MGSLEKYNRKRDFSRTPEPNSSKGFKGNLFVIQKHDARRLHYDFRLKIGDVLVSWAVPKGIPEGDSKHLAVHTEDHPLDYADFEGEIPEGNYGAGKVEVWDRGTYKNLKDYSIEKAHEKGLIEVELEGKKVKGRFALVNSKLGGDEKNWLLIRMKEDDG